MATTDFYQIGSFSLLESQLRALGRLAGLTYDEVSGYITRVWTSGPSLSQPRSPALTTPEVKVTGTAAVAAAGGRADGIPAPDYGVGSPPRSPPRLGSGDGAGSPGRCAACGVALSAGEVARRRALCADCEADAVSPGDETPRAKASPHGAAAAALGPRGPGVKIAAGGAADSPSARVAADGGVSPPRSPAREAVDVEMLGLIRAVQSQMKGHQSKILSADEISVLAQ